MSAKGIKLLKKLDECERHQLSEREEVVREAHLDARISLGNLGVSRYRGMGTDEAAQKMRKYTRVEGRRFQQAVQRLVAMAPPEESVTVGELAQQIRETAKLIVANQVRMSLLFAKSQQHDAVLKAAFGDLAVRALKGRRKLRGGGTR